MKGPGMNAEEAALIEDVRGRRDRQVELTRDLVAIPTVNPYSGDDSAGIETAGQEWIADRFRSLGAAVRNEPVPDDVYERGGVIGPAGRSWKDRDNVVAEWTFGNGDGPTILINDHMDTVGTEGMGVSPFDPVIKDGKMFGRGSADTKGNLVMGLVAVEALLCHADRLNGRIVFESVTDEECNGGGAGTLACCLAGVRGDFALCLDGVKSQAHNGCNGVATARVVVTGQAGHSSQGVSISAIDKAIEVKAAIDAFGSEHARKFPNCKVNIGIFRSGTLPAIVPGQAELQLNLNYTVADAEASERAGRGWNGSLFRERFERTLAALGESDAWFAKAPVRVEWIKDLYPFLTDPRNPSIVATLGAATEVQGRPAAAAPMPAWFDGAHIARQLQVPVLGVGAAPPEAPHSSKEYVVLSDLFAGAETVALAIHRLLRRDADG